MLSSVLAVYEKSNHLALIVGEHQADEYKYRKGMHSEKDGKRTNEKVYPNPNPKNIKKQCI